MTLRKSEAEQKCILLSPYCVLGLPGGSVGKESACSAGDLGLIPGLGRSPAEGNGYPLQDSGLEKAIDCIVHGATKSQTQLSHFHFHYYVLGIVQGASDVLLLILLHKITITSLGGRISVSIFNT